jgi:hypothetical protein
MLLQIAVEDIGQLTDLEPSPMGRRAVSKFRRSVNFRESA